MKEELIRFENLEKKNRGKQLFGDISFAISRGEMVGVMSDNLRVQWILSEILRGNELPDDGRIYIRGARTPFADAQSFLRKHVYVLNHVEKHAGDLTVLDLFYASGISVPLIGRRKRIRDLVEKAARLYEVKLPPLEKKADALSVLDNCLVALLRAVLCGAELVILSDLSAFLNEQDRARLLGYVRHFERRGISFFMTDHIRNVLLNYTERMILLRGGRTAYLVNDYSEEKLRALFPMTENTEEGSAYPQKEAGGELGTRSAGKGSGQVLAIRHLSTQNLRDFNLEVAGGEVVGLVDPGSYSASGLLSVLRGEEAPLSGQVFLNSLLYQPRDEYDAIHKGMAFIPENPVQSGSTLFSGMSVSDNVLLTISEKRTGMSLAKLERSIENECAAFFGSRAVARQKADDLDLLDQMRLIYFRWMLYYPAILVVTHPFSGSNIYMQQVTRQMIRMCAERGISVLLVANGASEAYQICDRTVFLS